MDEISELYKIATENAKKVLKPGDKIRVLPSRCHAKKVHIIFRSWDGNWIISKSLNNEYHAKNIDRLNGQPIDFTKQT